MVELYGKINSENTQIGNKVLMHRLIQGALTHSCTIIVAAIAILFIGGLCVTSIPVDILPVNNTAAVQVLTFYNGMPAEAVEKNITSRLERQTGQAAGRTRQESRSIQGASIVRNYFGDDVDPSGALTQVNSLASAAVKSMPRGTDPPVILPFDPTGTTPVCVVALDSKKHSESVLYDVGRYEVRNMIMGMPGANAPSILGGKRRAVIAYVDRHKLAARGLSPLAVMEAMDDYNLFVPAGQASFGDTTYAVSSNAMHESIEDMGDIPLRSEQGNAAYLEDVATPTDTSFTQTSLVRVDGRRQVYIPVYRQPGSSTLSVVDHLRKSLDEMTSRLSKEDIDLQLVMDQSVYVRQAIVSLVEEGVLGAVMCSLVILLFLGNVRMMGIAVLVIPLSVLVSVVGLKMTNNTINVMTLAGLALAIGPLVDLAVITLENTHRHLMRGADPPEAALLGANEVAKPAFVATCCTLIVLAPLAFLPELGSFLFLPMALALGFAMIAAFFLSLTLVPNCCAAWLKPESEDHESQETPRGWSGRVFAPLQAVLNLAEKAFYVASRYYEQVLNFVLSRPRRVVVGAMVLLLGSLVALGPQLKREFFPEVDSGAFEMTVRAASGTRLEVTEKRIGEVEEMLKETIGEDLKIVISEVGCVAGWSAAYTTNSGPMDASLKVQLTPDRDESAQEHVRRLRERFASSPEFDDLEFGFDTGGMIRAAMNGGKSTPINIRVIGKDLHKLHSVAEVLCSRVSDVEGVVDARILQRLDYPHYVIEVNRDRAADLGLPLSYVVKNVVAAINGSIQFNKKNVYIDPVSKGQYYVGVQYAEEDMESLESLLDVPITGPSQDVSIPLRNLVNINRSTVPTEVIHQDLQTGIDLVMAVDGRDLGHVADDVVAVLDQCGVEQEDGTWVPFGNFTESEDSSSDAGTPMEGVRIAMSGEYVRMQSMFVNLGFGLAMATLLVYLLLVILFQSFRLPLVILFAVPVGLIGVVWTLYLTDTAINVQSLLGVIFMVGVVVANTVLLIDYTQNLRETEELSAFEAIRRAACIRMRPILMTALAAFLALLPMALALARGSEANAPLGRAVVGGLIAGLFTTLLVVPCLYAWMIRDEKPAAESQMA